MARHYVNNRFPDSPADLARAMADPEIFAELFPKSDPRAFEDFADAYANASPLIARQIEEAAQIEAAKMLRNNPVDSHGYGRVSELERQAPGAAGPRAALAKRHHLYNKTADGPALDSLAKDPNALAKCFLAIAGGTSAGGMTVEESARYHSVMRNAMSERVPGQGGFLVPETLRSNILMASLETSIIRPRARIIPMDSLRVPYPTIDETTHTSSVLGGLIGSWTEESAQLAISQPGFGRIVLEAKKLAVYTEIPNELVNDASYLMDFLQDTLPAAVSFYEDQAFIAGSGVGQPQGYINSPGAVKVTRATGSKVAFVDIVNMYVRMYPTALRDAIWVCSPDVIGQLLQMALTGTQQVENSGTLVNANMPVAPPLWLTNQSAAQGAEYQILGHPLYVTEKAPALGTLGDLAFINPGFYLLGDRMEMSLTTSEHYKFANDLLAVRLLERCDGRFWLQSPITPENGGSTLSPLVLLN